MDNLPNQLKKARLKKGLSQQEVADELQVTRQSISKWENGHVCPDLYNLTLLSQLYEVPLDILIKNNRHFDLQIEADREEFIRVFTLLQQRELERVNKIEHYLMIAITICGLIPVLGLITSIYAVLQRPRRAAHNSFWWQSILILAISLTINSSLAYLVVTHHWLHLFVH